MSLASLLEEIRACTHCAASLPLGPRPVLRATSKARIVLIGQAPGARVHETGVPWDDASGERLCDWLGVPREVLLDSGIFAIVPMGFCYPGKAASGDSPPRPECAPMWHPRLLPLLKRTTVTILIGAYAQARYLGARCKRTLTETVQTFEDYAPDFIPLPHPSPRNAIWRKKNPWFEQVCVPSVRERVRALIESSA
jgi:uracil-DNA glycosylase